MKIQIKRKDDGLVLLEYDSDNNTVLLTVEAAVLAAAVLENASLENAELAGANLVAADLRGAKLTGASLRGADLTGADLTGADLTGADLRGAKLTGATYGEATLNLGFRQLLGLRWPVYFFDAHIKIGCKLYAFAEWESFDDKTISEMAKEALVFWTANKQMILGLAKYHQSQ